MGQKSNIEWCDSTVNFWSGCTKVSDGCKNCYAESLSNRKLGNIGGWGKGAARKRHESAFKLALSLNRKPWVCPVCAMGYAVNHPTPQAECCGQPLHRRRVFSLSLGDWLDPEVPIEWFADMLDTVRKCSDVDWLLVTKRPELFFDRLRCVAILESISDGLFDWLNDWQIHGKPPAHIMVLTSVENQQAADERIPDLLAIPAAKRGLSCEPLLGPVELNNNFLLDGRTRRQDKSLTPIGTAKRIDWVIVGGESGSGARPCNVEWIRSIKDQCAAAGVPCFVKQLGANVVGPENATYAGDPPPPEIVSWKKLISDKKGGDMAEWPESLRVRLFALPIC